ncbi:unnamed protein product [Periconia digitata]|uniref:Uncharacterized protein n=1 Tax=Periconia digitata TaxID=1303443 RepID=A0A9W4XV50_9PLEO|nr:unnamed protein product [Periconia digitata]
MTTRLSNHTAPSRQQNAPPAEYTRGGEGFRYGQDAESFTFEDTSGHTDTLREALSNISPTRILRISIKKKNTQ